VPLVPVEVPLAPLLPAPPPASEALSFVSVSPDVSCRFWSPGGSVSRFSSPGGRVSRLRSPGGKPVLFVDALLVEAPYCRFVEEPVGVKALLAPLELVELADRLPRVVEDDRGFVLLLELERLPEEVVEPMAAEPLAAPEELPLKPDVPELPSEPMVVLVVDEPTAAPPDVEGVLEELVSYDVPPTDKPEVPPTASVVVVELVSVTWI
jgi:hypothetical protein